MNKMSVQNNQYEITKNLLQNPDGSDDFKHWIPIDLQIEIEMETLITDQHQSRFEGWSIESGENAQTGVNEKDKEITSNFVTSCQLVGKAQIIDLNSHGVNVYDMIVEENGKYYWPRLEIKEKFASRFDCAINYHLRVYLVTEKYEICDEFVFEQTQNANMNWNEVHNIREINNSIRYIVFVHGGSDTQRWAGFYGPKMSNGSIVIKSHP